MIISFAWTTPALLAGAKTMTRREWTPAHAAHFHAGDMVDAYDKSPRAHGHKVATIRLTRDPYRQFTRAMAIGDAGREGFIWLSEHGAAETVSRIIEDWTDRPRVLWVVEFELVEVLAAAAPGLGSGDAAAASSPIGGGLR